MSEVKTDKVSSITTNGDLTLDPNGTGDTIIASGNLGVGTASPSELVHLVDGDPKIRFEDSDAPSGTYNLIDANGASGRLSFSADDGDTASGSHMRFLVDGSEAVRINEDGAVLVGKIAANFATPGAEIAADGRGVFTRDSNTPLFVNRETDNGELLQLRKDNQFRGALGLESDGFYIDGETSHAGLTFAANQIIPRKDGALIDNTIDLGSGSFRYDDVRATNGTIQTSDQNEKQQIASLTTAEITAAKALSKLFKTFKWNSAVTAKGDAARTHAGVIAQEVQIAMTDAGLTAADYAFWCSDTWWESNGQTYNTADEAPEGAVERTRLGIRYPELLAFIGAATEQRLTDIETRLTALEAE